MILYFTGLGSIQGQGFSGGEEEIAGQLKLGTETGAPILKQGMGRGKELKLGTGRGRRVGVSANMLG